MKKVVDENITKCYINKVASERRSSSLKTERNKQRETSIFYFMMLDKLTLLESLILAQDER
ncbi:hypothetical protein, partial [Bacillus paranthracis]|uniref:hypothetical protein n=1 Tax=Bacillus paranthracis TaxID=2026186 RepID=UPI001E46BC3F